MSSAEKMGRALQDQRKALPIAAAEDRIVEEIKKHDMLIIVGETGSGKTTQVPQFLHAAGLCDDGLMIGITQPRRVAAMSVASRVASEMDVRLGEEVGYSIRFEDVTSRSTRIKYMTDGMLLREVLLDPLLSKYSVVIVDEAHERTVNTDVLFGLLKRVQAQKVLAARAENGEGEQQNDEIGERKDGVEFVDGEEGGNGAREKKIKKKAQKKKKTGMKEEGRAQEGANGRCSVRTSSPLKLIIMSATLEVGRFAEFFAGATIVHVEGRQYPVERLYTSKPMEDYLDAAMVTAIQVHQHEASGDVLVFLTGQEEIESLERLLKEKARSMPELRNMVVVSMYAAMPSEQQMRVFDPPPAGHRKIILATNIAETSLTIPGIRYVIDPGLVKARAYDPKIGVESLIVVPVSKAQARQRAGRAGREAAGKCYRLYMEEEFAHLDESTVPEIRRCSLASVVLELKALGIDDVLGFDFLDKPPRAAIVRSLEQLYVLGALTSTGKLSHPVGKLMSQLPLDPLYSKAIFMAAEQQCTEEMIAAVAMLSVDSVFYCPREKQAESMAAKRRFLSTDGDHITLINLFKSDVEEACGGRGMSEGDEKADGTRGTAACFGQGEVAKKHGKRKRTRNEGAVAWCRQNFVHARALCKAVDVRNQLRGYCESMGLPLISCGKDLSVFRKCLAASFFLNAARRQPDGSYRAISSGQTVSIHPSSSMFGTKPDCVVFNEMVRTNRLYIRDVSRIDSLWLVEFAPQYYRKKPPSYELNAGR